MRGAAALSYGVFCWLVSVGSLFYFGFWLLGVVLPKTINTGTVGDPRTSFAINVALLTIYCGAHSLFARTSLKQRMRAFIPRNFERSTYCLFFALGLIGLGFAWRPMPTVVWQVESALGARLLIGLAVLGWLLHYGAIIWMGHHEFWGLRQTRLAARGEEYYPPPPMTEKAYMQSHVLLIVTLIAIPWFVPTMSTGQLFFCVFLTFYNVLGAWWSSRDPGDQPAPITEESAQPAAF